MCNATTSTCSADDLILRQVDCALHKCHSAAFIAMSVPQNIMALHMHYMHVSDCTMLRFIHAYHMHCTPTEIHSMGCIRKHQLASQNRQQSGRSLLGVQIQQPRGLLLACIRMTAIAAWTTLAWQRLVGSGLLAPAPPPLQRPLGRGTSSQALFTAFEVCNLASVSAIAGPRPASAASAAHGQRYERPGTL